MSDATPFHVQALQGVVSVHEAARRLAAALGAWHTTEGATTRGLVLRHETHVPEAPLRLLEAIPELARMVCRAPGTPDLRFGIGSAGRWDGGATWPASLPSWLGHPDPALPLFVTTRFDPTRPASKRWAALGGVRACLPAVTLTLGRDHARLEAYAPPAEDGAAHATIGPALEALTALARPLPPTQPTWRSVLIEERPTSATWNEHVEALLAHIRSGRIAKGVLARARTYALDGCLDPFAFLRRAARAQPEGTPYGIVDGTSGGYVGVTPEVLFERAGTRLQTHALAGTRPRRQDPTEDEALGAELMASAKDLAEHEFVRAFLAAALAPLCAFGPTWVGPHLRRLADLQHLDTRVEGTLGEGADDGALLAALHPTPAVCGVPTQEARTILAELEPFDRGLYAGAMGWMEPEAALMVVCIRGAHVSPDHVTLYGGAGIVEGSDPEAEWLETAAKMRGLDDILRVGHDA